MSLTTTEAQAVHTLLDYLLDPANTPVGKVKLAAETLANRAHRALNAGLDAKQVAERWPTAVGEDK